MSGCTGMSCIAVYAWSSLGGPVGDRIDLGHHVAAGQDPAFDDLGVATGVGLVAAQAGDPHVVRLEGGEQGPGLAVLAALVGVRAVERAEVLLLRLWALVRPHRTHVEAPHLGEQVLELEGFLEVVTGVDEEHRDVAAALTHEVEHGDTAGLERAGDRRTQTAFERGVNTS